MRKIIQLAQVTEAAAAFVGMPSGFSNALLSFGQDQKSLTTSIISGHPRSVQRLKCTTISSNKYFVCVRCHTGPLRHTHNVFLNNAL